MNDTQPHKRSALDKGKALLGSRALRITLASLAALFLLFGALGYFWLPGFAKAKLETLLTEEFARPVSVDKIEISPYALSLTVRGFSVGQKGVQPGQHAGKGPDAELFGFDSLFVDLSTSSMARGIPVVSKVALVGPRLHLARTKDGRLNVSDLLDKWLAGPSSPTPEFSVSDITIRGGAVTFNDTLLGARHELAELNLGIPFIANTSGTVESSVEPTFSAKVNGSPLNLAGAVKPFAPGKDASLDIDISDFDLMRVMRYAPSDLPLALESGRMAAQLKVSFAKPEGTNAAVRLSGTAELDGLAARLPRAQGQPLRLRLDKAALKLDEATLAGVLRCGLSLSGASLSTPTAKEPLLGFGRLDVSGISVTSAGRKAEVAELRLDKPYGRVRRQQDKGLDIVAALEGLGQGTAPAPKATAKPTPKPAGKTTAKPTGKTPSPWAWSVGRVVVSGGGLHYADDSLGQRIRPLEVRELAISVAPLASAGQTPSTVSVSARINDRGTLKLDGNVRREPQVKADLALDMSHVDLVALQGFASTELHALLTRGEVSLKGALSADGPKASFTGDAALVDFSVLDKVNSADLLRWRSVTVSRINLGTEPLRIDIGEIAASNFFVRLLLTSQGRLNLNDVLRKEEDEQRQAQATEATSGAKPAPAVEAAPPAVATAKPTAKPTGPAPQIRVGRIVLAHGGINFTDRFVKPNYTANLTDLSGRIGELKAGRLTDIALRGKVDGTGLLDISGKADPLGEQLNLDLHAKATGIEMAGFSPYSGRYVGYVIEKGKLSVDLRYLVKDGQLEAQNNVFLDQLTFGKKVESPDALSIPVGLVVALLKNSRGEIDIDLPIKGSLDDPEFSVGGVIVKVLMNLITKAVTSPFTLLASLFGGGEELSYVAFEPGRDDLTPEAQKHLETLAKALRDRTGLKLEIAGAADPAREEDGLKRARLETRVKAQKATELARQGKTTGGVADITLTQEEYAKYLERVYKASDVKKPRNIVGLAKSIPVEQMEALLLADMQTPQGAMERLARNRSVAVQSWLVETGGVEQARVFLLAPRVGVEPPKGAPAGGRVDFSLR